MTSHPFTPSLVSVKILKYVIARAILEYKNSGDPVTYINSYRFSLLGKTDNYDQLVFLFTLTHLDKTYSWLFSLPAKSIESWKYFKTRILEFYMGECQLLTNMIFWMM